MPRTVGKKTLVTKDIWIAFATRKLSQNPGWWSRHKKNTKFFSIGYINGKGERVEFMNYNRYRKNVEYYFDAAKRAIIQGDCINMTAQVGKICAKRVERDFRKKQQQQVDWAKTRKQEKVWNEEKQKMTYPKYIFFTGDDWSRIGWFKNKQITNEAMYEFKPAAPNAERTGGFKLEFSRAMQEDPMLKYQYLFCPLIIKPAQ